MPLATWRRATPPAALATLALALAGCGGSNNVPNGSRAALSPPGPYLQNLSTLRAALQRAGIPLQLTDGTAGDYGSLPHPERSVAFRAPGHTDFTVLVYRDQDTALRAIYSLRQGGRTPLERQNLIVVFARSATVESHRIAGVLEHLGEETT